MRVDSRMWRVGLVLAGLLAACTPRPSPADAGTGVVPLPDVYEDNDTVPSTLSLVPEGEGLSVHVEANLTTDQDTDRFVFQVPASANGGPKILSVRLTLDNQPPLPGLVQPSLTVLTGEEGQEASAAVVVAPNPTRTDPVDLGRVLQVSPGRVQLVVRAHPPLTPPESQPVTLNAPYTLEVRLYEQLDENEPNDTTTERGLVRIDSPSGTPYLIKGRLEHSTDQDYLPLRLASFSSGQGREPPTRLHYKVSWSQTPGRFPPLPGRSARRVQVLSEVEGSTPVSERAVQCRTKPTTCPKDGEGEPDILERVNALCESALCLRSERNESASHPNLENFEGVIPIPSHSTELELYVHVSNEGTDQADDREYTVELRWSRDPDEESREEPRTVPMAMDLPTSSGFPVPPANATVLSGTLGHGHGRLNALQSPSAGGIRGAHDYDAVPGDVDTYVIDIPPQDPSAGPLDRTWELQWQVGLLPDGASVHGLALDVLFCDGNQPGKNEACTQVGTSAGKPFTLMYEPAPRPAWHGAGPPELLYTRAVEGNTETVTARAQGCFCLEPRFIRGGKLYVNVTAADRRRYEDVSYSVRMALTSYPQSYLAADGILRSCPAPAPAPEGGYQPGCQFAR
ncbi:putative lipoprotein [Cystobacter fuscus DSM 2262]|uniref:Lipoprotein n=1 Tax=Cystobacter fuscus (strain ATCC 25194 / DSM 2262 / NBRC 100088 / M29) TaxID=1242864 RepID=S9PGH7_CYSF2|nr:hypothetical protein [Cystobacter fuscus]EPX61502.1 putative lipoprotein [Cystobacter fuscus DSM 2262]